MSPFVVIATKASESLVIQSLVHSLEHAPDPGRVDSLNCRVVLINSSLALKNIRPT